MSQHGGRSFHGHRKEDKEAPKKDTEELTEDHEEEEDPFDTRIKNSGCADLHYALLVSYTRGTFHYLSAPIDSDRR